MRPHLDDKVLASWNGLMLGAMARAYAVLGDATYLQAAEKNLAFLQAKLWDAKTRTLYHRWRDGERDQVQLLDGYAFLLSGVIDLYEATLQPKHLDFAIALAEAMLARFYDAENGGFWQSPPGAKDLILRVKEDYDGAEPSGNSVAVPGAAEARQDHRPQGFHAGRREDVCACSPIACSKLRRLCPSCSRPWTSPSTNPGARWSPATRPGRKPGHLLRAIHSVYQPNKVVLGNTGAVEPFAQTLPAKDGPVVYLCTGSACQAPTSDPAKVKELLSVGQAADHARVRLRMLSRRC